MSSLARLPSKILLEILRKMTFKSWIRTRMTCKYIFRFVIEHKSWFCFKTVFTLSIDFYPKRDTKVYLIVRGSRARLFSSFLLDDFESQTAGILFNWIEFTPDHAWWTLVHKVYKTRKSKTFESRALELCRKYDLKAEGIKAILGPLDLLEATDILPCYSFHFKSALGRSDEVENWINDEKMRKIKSFKCDITCFTHLRAILERFPYSHATLLHNHENGALDVGEGINIILKEQMKKKLIEPKTFVFTCWDIKRFQTRTNPLNGIAHKHLLMATKQKMRTRCTGGNEYADFSVRIILIQEKELVAINILITNSNYVRCYFKIWPEFNSAEIVEFLGKRAMGLKAIDMSGLEEQLNSDNLHNVLSRFLGNCYHLEA